VRINTNCRIVDDGTTHCASLDLTPVVKVAPSLEDCREDKIDLVS
jgi:hypothetical protein